MALKTGFFQGTYLPFTLLKIDLVLHLPWACACTLAGRVC